MRFLLRSRGTQTQARRARLSILKTRKVVYRVWALLLLAVALGLAAWFNKPWIAAQLKEWSAEASLAGFAGLVALGALLLSVLWWLIKTVSLDTFLDFIGDAARYFDVTPKNVARRYDILRGGIQLLKDLHEDRDETSTRSCSAMDALCWSDTASGASSATTCFATTGPR